MAMKQLKCKMCGATFDERPGLPGLKCCQHCDDTGRSGISCRQRIVVTKGGQHVGGEILYQSPGNDAVVN